MREIIIDEEFKGLLPELDKETYDLLEKNLLENGCRDAVVLWNGILIDGHNRYEICTKHGIPFDTVSKEFATREEALIWIITTQVSRRNLSQIQLSYCRGLHYRADKKVQGTNNQYSQKSEKPQNEVFQKSTAERLAKQYNVSRTTIERDAKVAEAIDAIGAVSPEAKRKILARETIISKIDLEGMSFEAKEEIEAATAHIENGEYGKKKQEDRKLAEQENPAGAILTSMQVLDKAISKILDGFYSQLPKITAADDRSELKASLRSCIEKLEALHKAI